MHISHLYGDPNHDREFISDVINKIVKKKNTLSYSITPKKFVSIALSDEGVKETAQIYGSFPLSKSIHFFWWP